MTTLNILLFCIFISFQCRFNTAALWPQGVVHFAINQKDYDLHSQDEIMATLDELQKDLCVKFFQTPLNYSTEKDKHQILFISNPNKQKTCPPVSYDFSTPVVDLTIGYKCLNRKDIARILIDMLRSSIKQTRSRDDIDRKFSNMDEEPSGPRLVSLKDRDYINTHYSTECGLMAYRPPVVKAALRTDESKSDENKSNEPDIMSSANREFYDSRVWPLGVVLYDFERKFQLNVVGPSDNYKKELQLAMAKIERASCVVFHQMDHSSDYIEPRNLIVFGLKGEATPPLGIGPGRVALNLTAFVEGDPGHSANVLNNLMRLLGIPMESNMFVRDHYVKIHWENIIQGEQHLLEHADWRAVIRSIPYDFDSVRHAPTNYKCGDKCNLGDKTVEPLQDPLWRRSLTSGHTTELSKSDKQYLEAVYARQCQKRYGKL